MKTRKFFGTQGFKFCVIALAAVTAFALIACAGGPTVAPGEVQLFDGAEISMVYVVPTAQYGTVQEAPGEGGFAFFFSNAKTMLESGTYEVLLFRGRPAPVMDVRGNTYLEFEIMADNLELLDDIVGFFPRINNGDVYVQFDGTSAMLEAVAQVTEVHQWVTVSVPITQANIHERADDFRTVTPRVNGIRLRLILQDFTPIEGRIYLRNIQFI